MQVIELNGFCYDSSKSNAESQSGIDTISYGNIPYSTFLVDYLTANRPCVIKAVTDDWKCREDWVICGSPNFEYLSHHYGCSVVPTADCDKKFYDSQEKENMNFDVYLEYWRDLIQANYPPESPCFYLKDWHFFREYPSLDVYKVPTYFASDWLNEFYLHSPELNDDYRFVYMGPKGTWTPFHKDVFSSFSWSVNICGKKEWVFYPPEEESLLKDKFGNLPYNLSESSLSEENPNLKSAFSMKIIQEVGDAIFVPTGWFHQVWNLEDTISVNHNWINGCNIMAVYENMIAEFGKVKNELSDCSDSADWSCLCQNLLKATFGMNIPLFFDFLIFIAGRRINSLKKLCPLPLSSGFYLGLNHAKFDLECMKPVLKNLDNINECGEKPMTLLDEINSVLEACSLDS